MCVLFVWGLMEGGMQGAAIVVLLGLKGEGRGATHMVQHGAAVE